MTIESSNTTGISTIQGLIIRYTIQKDRNGDPTSVTANIYDGTNIVGTANCSANGEFGISITERAGLSDSVRSAVVNQILSDFSETFTPAESGGSAE